MAKYVIVGGVAGGASAAARLRRLDEKAEIIIFERGKYISYANCGLPYYIGGKIAEREWLFVQTPESFKVRLNVEVQVESEVISIDPSIKHVVVKNLVTGEEYRETYDKLILSPGAEPVRPPIPGVDDEAIFTLRNVPDTDRLKEYITHHRIRRAVIVGAGFIGLEMAENLHRLGIFVTIVEMAEQVMTPLDYEMAAEVHQHLKTKKVEFYLKDSVTAFQRDTDGLHVRLDSGRDLITDLVVLSVGVRPDSHLAEKSGLRLGVHRGIAVNEYLQTSDPDIYAVGDAICYPHPVTGKDSIAYLAGPANKQGRIAADNVHFGNKYKYEGAIGTAIAKVFDITVASTGVSEKTLKADKIHYQASIIHASSHAGYYPDALPMTIKILFDPQDGRLLGSQIVGFDGVDKRIDMMAHILKHRETVFQLKEIEHAYAPPFSSAKDPVNIAGMVAENVIRGLVKIIQWYDIMSTDKKKALLIDVRMEDEFALGSIEGAVNIPVDGLRNRLSEIPKDKTVILFCGIGQRAYLAARILMQNGFSKVFNLSGGYITYSHATGKQSNEDIFSGDVIGKDDHIYQTPPLQELDGNEELIEIDACGLQYLGPILWLKQEFDRLSEGKIIRITCTDAGFLKDVPAWCKMTGNQLISVDETAGKITAIIRKGGAESPQMTVAGHNKTIVVFSDELDRALASFVIAHGAASTGKKVTMFFTFWGLNVIKRTKKPASKKDLMSQMFGLIMPSHSKRLGLSKINFGGIGAKLMRKRMQDKNVDSLEAMIARALYSGVELIACQMSMDVMGVTAEDLIDGVTIGGVITYLAEAEQSNLNLFI
ncbi:MAG: FAD-dependent oxidoreductase [Candidatus Cloacimonetes bacterium]|nr:FAD-dependent oxidoreductase [Candidatus Cloacimonadota bacterium]